MGRIFWVGPLVQNTVGRPYWMPKIEQVLGAQLDPYQSAWTTTDANRATPWAVGASILTTAAQLTLVQAESAIRLVEEASWTNTFSQLPAQWRNRVNSFCDSIGVARPQPAEVLRDLFHRLVGVLEGAKSIESILTEASTR